MGNTLRKSRVDNTTSRPLISFIVPAYNAEDTIERCLRSVVGQRHGSYELIVVDDGSTDSTKKIVQSIGCKKIKYYHKKNGGVSSARNYGLSKAAGEWIIFLDSDDAIIMESLESLLGLLLDDKNDFIVTPIKAYAKKGDVNNTGNITTLDKYNYVDDIIFRLPKKRTRGISITRNLGGNIIRKRIIDDNNIRFVDGLRFFEDGIFNISVALHANKVLYSDTLFYDYDDSNSNSRMNTFCPDILKDNLTIKEEISGLLKAADYASPSFPYLLVELFSTSLFAAALSTGTVKSKVEVAKTYDNLYLKPIRGSINAKYLTKVLRIEYRLCSLGMYRTLLLLCKVKAGVKRARGRM